MNKIFSAALYCGLLLSGGKAFADGTALLKRLDDEKIIGQRGANPFNAAETATTIQNAAANPPNRRQVSLQVRYPAPVPLKITRLPG